MADGILGLLGAGVDKVQGLLGNPTVQGAALAAATGFNPLLGLLAGPGIQSARERKSLENDLLRQSLLDSKRRSAATEELTGLLGEQTTGTVSSPIGLMNVEGGVDAIPATRMRQVPTVATPGGQQRLMGLLAQLAPEQAASSLLSQPERSETSLVRNVRALNDPTLSPEQRQIIADNLRNDPNVTDDLLAKLQLQMNMMQLEEAQRKRAEEERTAAKNRRTSETSLEATLDHLKEAAELNARLAPTLLASGASGQDVRRAIAQGVTEVKRLFGVDTSKAEQLIADYDRFQKLNSQFIVGSMANIGGEGLGTVTNDKLQLLMKSMAGTGISPQANALIYADTIDDLLQVAEIEGFDIGGQDSFVELADALRGRKSGNDVVTVNGVTVEFLD